MTYLLRISKGKQRFDAKVHCLTVCMQNAHIGTDGADNILFLLWSVLQEFVEALQSSVSVSVLANLSSIHGLHDLPVLPHGLLASHNNLLIHPHLTAGNTQADESSHTIHLNLFIVY